MIVIKWDFPTSKIEVTRKVVFAYCDSPNVNSPLGCSPNRRGPHYALCTQKPTHRNSGFGTVPHRF